MNVSSTIVKKTAITALKNKYTGGVVCSSIYLFTWLICIFVTELVSNFGGMMSTLLLFAVLCVFLILPLTLGLIYWGIRIIFSGDSEPVLIFKYFSSRKDYIRSIRLWLPITGNALFYGFLLFLPAVFADMVANGRIFILFGVQIPLWASSIWGISVALRIIASLCLIFVLLKFYLAPFLLVADENMEPLEAIHMSKVIATRSRKDFIWLVFSFTGYIIACIFMIPIVFILPYLTASYAVHCRFEIAAYNNNIDRINQKNIPGFEADISF